MTPRSAGNVSDAGDLSGGESCQPLTSILMKDGDNPALFRSRKSESGSPVIAMVQPSQSWLRHDQLWAWMVPLEHDELLTKGQILEKEAGMRAKEANQRSEAESKETRHIGEL